VAAHSGRKAQLIQRYLAAAHGSQLKNPKLYCIQGFSCLKNTAKI
jgi:hypothetical protein